MGVSSISWRTRDPSLRLKNGCAQDDAAVKIGTVPGPNLKTRLKRAFLATVLTVVGVAALTFGLDYAVLRLRVAANWNPYGTVTVDHYYAVLQKSGKTEFIFDPPGPQTCVHALFPHEGWLPCWYLSRHPEQRTDI